MSIESAIEKGDSEAQEAIKTSGAFFTYLRAQLTSLIATASDFSVTIFLKEIVGIWYLYAVALGAAVGALIAFALNRNWVFSAASKSVSIQIFRYGIVAAGSWLLNTGGVYLMTEFIEISYLYSKIFVSILIGLSYNFILAKRFVFA